MPSSSYVVRDDKHYTVVIGWNDRLHTFFARVFSRFSADDRPVRQLGERPGEIPALSVLIDAVQGYATVDAETIGALRHDADSLTG